jgi:hypothetical protein
VYGDGALLITKANLGFRHDYSNAFIRTDCDYGAYGNLSMNGYFTVCDAGTSNAHFVVPGDTNQPAWFSNGTGGFGIGTTTPVTALDVNGGLTVRNGIRPNYVKISSGTSITPASSSYGTYFDITTSTITGLTISYPASGQWANDSNGYWVFRNNTGTYLSMIVSYTAGTPTSCPSNITIPPASSVTLMATYPGGASCNYVLF